MIIDALRIYQECKKHHPIRHPLATKLQTCTSPSSVLGIVQEQIRELGLSRSRREGWRKWVAPTLNLFFAIAATVGIVGLVCPRLRLSDIYTHISSAVIYCTHCPIILMAKCTFCRRRRYLFSEYCRLGVGSFNTYILQAAQAAGASEDVFLDTFERVEMFLQRLEMYTEAQLTTEMTDILVQIMVEVLFILEIATNEINQSRMSG